MSKFRVFALSLTVLLFLAGSATAQRTVLYHSQADDGREFLVRLLLDEDGAAGSVEVKQAPQRPGAEPGLDLVVSGPVTTQDDQAVMIFEGGSLEVPVTDNGAADPLGAGTLQLAGQPELSLHGVGMVIRGELGSPDSRFVVSAQFPFFLREPWAGQQLFGDAGLSRNLKEGLELFSQGAGEPWNWYQLDEMAFLTAFSSRVMSGMQVQFSFTGGAHPNTVRQTRTLLGSEYGSWYEAGYLCAAALHLGWACDDAHVRQQVISQLQREEASWVVAGEVTAETPWLLDKFVLNPNGVTIVFDPYEAGAYVEGLYLVDVPYGQLAP